MDSDTVKDWDSDSKPDGYIVLCSTCSHWKDSDPYSPFLYETGIQVRVRTRIRVRQCVSATSKKNTLLPSTYPTQKYFSARLLSVLSLPRWRCLVPLYLKFFANSFMTFPYGFLLIFYISNHFSGLSYILTDYKKHLKSFSDLQSIFNICGLPLLIFEETISGGPRISQTGAKPTPKGGGGLPSY